LLAQIESVVAGGMAVMAGEDTVVVAAVKDTINSGRSINFYLSQAQAGAVKSWYWTPERVRNSGLEPISAEEKSKIESTLGIRNIKYFCFSRVTCECGKVYGAFEFLRQGIREHGVDMVNALFALQGVAVLRVNPVFTPICPSCEQMLRMDDGCITYEGDTYAGCSYCQPPM
jgi:hypothetical protein